MTRRLLPLLLPCLALLLVACVGATDPIIEAANGNLRLVTKNVAGSDVLFVFSDGDERSARGIYDQLDALRSSVVKAKDDAIALSKSDLDNRVSALTSSISTTASVAASSISAARTEASTAVASARTEASTLVATARTDSTVYTDTKTAAAEDHAEKTAIALIKDAMAKNTGTNGTIDAYVSTLLAFQDRASDLIEDLQSRLEVVENFQADPPITCKDVALGFAHIPNLRSQLYDIYPNGTFASRMSVFCQHQLVLDKTNIALGRPTSQSSTTNAGVSSRAVDGRESGVYSDGQCTHTGDELEKWWYVDLGGEFYVDKIDIVGRTDCCWDRLNGLKIHLATRWGDDKGKNDPECTPGISYTFSQSAPSRSIQCSNRVSAQFVIFRIVTATATPFTLCEVKINGQLNENNGGWTVIAAQPDGLLGNIREWYRRSPPTLTSSGVLEFFFKNDLRNFASEIYVENQAGESFIFKTKDFNGPLVLDGPNFASAGDNLNHGIIAGGDFPVVVHYQIGQVCSAVECYVKTDRDSSGTYSPGVLAVFDWSEGDTSTSATHHAHFGGTLNLESGWAKRGKYIMIR